MGHNIIFTAEWVLYSYNYVTRNVVTPLTLPFLFPSPPPPHIPLPHPLWVSPTSRSYHGTLSRISNVSSFFLPYLYQITHRHVTTGKFWERKRSLRVRFIWNLEKLSWRNNKYISTTMLLLMFLPPLELIEV